MPTSPPLEHAARPLVQLWAPILGLGLTQLIGWGATFTALGILGGPICRDLGLPREAVFGGITVMLLVSAILAPSIGRRIDRDGARRVMIAGTLVGALALMVVAAARGPALYGIGWALLGVATAMMMTNAAIPALVDIAGPHARPAVTAHTIVTGLTSTLFLPLTAWLEVRTGWRSTLLVFSVMYLTICLPIHLAILPAARSRQGSVRARDDAQSWDGLLPDAWRPLCFWLIALWLALQGFVVWGFNIQVVDILTGIGISHADAILVWMFAGPAQALSRVGDLVSGGRSGIMSLAIASAAALPVGFAVLAIGGAGSLPALVVLAITAGAGQGLHAVARNLVPLRLFGMATYGTTIGQLTLPLNISNAASPLIFSVLISRVGASAALVATAVAAVLALVTVTVLSRIAARALAGSERS